MIIKNATICEKHKHYSENSQVVGNIFDSF